MPCVSHEALLGVRVGLLLGVPLEQVAPGREAQGSDQGPCERPAAEAGRSCVAVCLGLPASSACLPRVRASRLSRLSAGPLVCGACGARVACVCSVCARGVCARPLCCFQFLNLQPLILICGGLIQRGLIAKGNMYDTHLDFSAH